MSATALTVSDLSIAVAGDDPKQILSSIGFSIARGEKIGLVGQSGSGKSMLTLSMMGLLPSTVTVTGGSIVVGDTEVIGASAADLRAIRGSRIAMVYQDPMSSLNPRQRVGAQIAEGILAHENVGKAVARRRAIDLLGAVGIRDPHRTVDSYPHEFSGGMRQRVMIAMAISCEPDVLLADECTTALDVTTQAKIIELLDELVDQRGMGVVFVTHDMAVAAGFCDRVTVMRHGVIVEEGSTRDVLVEPRHPYTKALVGSICTFETDPDQPMPTFDDRLADASAIDDSGEIQR